MSRLVSSLRDLFQGRPRKELYMNVSTVDSDSGDELKQQYEPTSNKPGQHSRTAPPYVKAIVFFLGGFTSALALAVAVARSLPIPSAPSADTSSFAGVVQPAIPGLYFSDTVDPHPLLNRSCGQSVAEARQAGCVFDLLSTAWTPAECVDLSVTEEFITAITKDGAWPYYHDKEGRLPFEDMEVLRAGDWVGQELWSTMRLHQHHCLFTWRRMHIAYNGGPPVDTVSRGLRHTKHCAKMLLHRDPPESVSGLQHVYFRSC
ncbi:hypothetical protein KVR01_000741 [Diaporthe batatas]|uniref:uncharacterized protein n=1 Tax=Diaporthe batatas TaxID=748121 RepID=UPI001D03A2B0|nr:uncharacterized protein KVR01_000741 [Diaporthe batatas]KAG8169996.1 hypothetical protein KVR01_000741 [Diaporthe batatas]